MTEAAGVPGVVLREVRAGGLRLRVAERGEGPLVLLCHGFPESWYSWRHQLVALAEAGFRAVAPDMRGYGGSDRPADPAQYTQLHLVGDMVALLDALGEETAVIVGHDWGAPVAWHAALFRPDRFRAVAGLSVPFMGRAPRRPTELLKLAARGGLHYMLHFQTPGVADAEFARDPRAGLSKLLWAASGDAPPELAWRPVTKAGVTPLDAMPEPPARPPWLTEADLDYYTAEFARTGFTGGLNWYRALDATWELTAPWQGATIRVPALYVAGDRDAVYTGSAHAIDRLPRTVPGLRRAVILPGCGHWTQQERPADVNDALLDFLQGL